MTGIIPDNGPLGGGTAVTISGNYFLDGLTALFRTGDGDMALLNVVFVDEHSFTAVTPAWAFGFDLVDLVVTNPDTLEDTLVGAFQYNP